jgi:hypothetical protein
VVNLVGRRHLRAEVTGEDVMMRSDPYKLAKIEQAGARESMPTKVVELFPQMSNQLLNPDGLIEKLTSKEDPE